MALVPERIPCANGFGGGWGGIAAGDAATQACELGVQTSREEQVVAFGLPLHLKELFLDGLQAIDHGLRGLGDGLELGLVLDARCPILGALADGAQLVDAAVQRRQLLVNLR